MNVAKPSGNTLPAFQTILVTSNDKAKHPDKLIWQSDIPRELLRKYSSSRPLWRPPSQSPKKK
jgi:hypothetical protein